MRTWVMRLLPLALLPIGSPAVSAEDACAGFSWDVHHERELFAAEPETVRAGRTVATAPALATDHLYEIELVAQPEVTFAAPPGRTWPAEATYAGLATLTVATAGVYRIALDQAAWIDMIANGAPIHSGEFQGRSGCSAPHKIVAFTLPAGTPVLLQVSGGVVSTIRITVTRAPVKAPHHAH